MIFGERCDIIILKGEFDMKKIFCFIFSFLFIMILFSCVSVPRERNRQLSLTNGYSISETDFGGVERWYAVDKYNFGNSSDEVRFQVGYFKEGDIIGFILYGTGTTGESAFFSRNGLDLRWDWGLDTEGSFKYSFVIQPDGTGLYYDFSTSKDGNAKPRGIYTVHKF